MCGIYGAIGPILEDSVKEQIASSMGQALRRRGPDNIDYIDIPGGFIGHTRLSLVDLSSAGNQPMMTKNKNIISFNGEIYNFIELRQEVKGELKSNTDTEVLLRLIEQNGFVETLKKCRGMFAIAFYSSSTNTLLLARDRMGEKPLYYSHQKESFIFSSDLNAIAKSKLINLRLCDSAVAEYFNNGFITAPLSIYKNVFKLCPGDMLEVKFSSGKVIDLKNINWFNLSSTFSPKLDQNKISFDEIVAKAKNILCESISLQSNADAKIGSFLSGGVDSSVVTAIMAQTHSNFETFTMGSADKRFNESKIAANFASYLGLKHNVIYFEDINLINQFEILSEAYSEPLADSSQIPSSIVSMIASKKVKGVLTGDGGDELFGGYYRHGSGLKTWKYLRKFSSNKTLISFIRNIEKIMPTKSMEFMSFFGIANARDKFRKISGLLSVNKLDDYYKLLVSNSLSWGAPYLKKPLINEFVLKELPYSVSDADILCFWDQDNYLPGDNLAKIDRISMYHSLETRSPFLDKEILQLMNSISYEKKTEKGPKSVLKEIQKQYYPKHLIGAPKRGFSIPLDQLMRGSLKNWFLESLLFNEHELFNVDTIMQIWNSHQNGANFAPDIWKIICFNRWYENHFVNQEN